MSLLALRLRINRRRWSLDANFDYYIFVNRTMDHARKPGRFKMCSHHGTLRKSVGFMAKYKKSDMVDENAPSNPPPSPRPYHSGE